jgi:sialate O-acetylesterase
MQTSTALPTNEKKISEKTADGRTVPEFKVSGVFSSHMVLQRDKQIRVWGFSQSEGSSVTAEFDGETVCAEVKDNRFDLYFSPRAASSEPKSMKIYDDKGHTTVFEDILIGDVWLIGGQSNSELNLRFCLPETLPKTFDDSIPVRLFMQTQAYPYTHQDLCAYPQPDVIAPEWCWRRPNEEASLSFSALGWFFANELYDKLNVPIGAINVSAGGACIRELIPEELAEEMGYDYGANVRQCGYYNTLIHPFEGLAFKGQVFFQGESEGCLRELAERYDRELARLVEDERARFGFDFPFYNVQISSYRDEGKQYFPFLETVRIKQFDALSMIPDSYLSVSMDIGSPDDWGDFAHSPLKKALAERIAALALAKEYGIGSLSDADSPMPEDAKIDGKTAVIKFRNVSDGLISISGDDSVNGFSFGDFDKKVPAAARIVSADTVVVDVPDGADTSALNYAYESKITKQNAQLYKKGGLPAPAFRIKL